jgi:hypothetical protein|tara:strand:- start:35 stop:469 length:435 start_codon:yes stop_codon:yes gene_type:complete
MAALRQSEVRQRAAAAVAGALSDATESPIGYERLAATPNRFAHRAFAVQVRSAASAGGRQRLTEGAFIAWNLAVLMLNRSRPKDQIASYDETLDDRETVVQAVFGMSLVDLNLSLTEMRSPVEIADGWLGTETVFRIQHHIALQ